MLRAHVAIAQDRSTRLLRRIASVGILAALSLTVGASPATATVTIGSDLATPPTQGQGCAPEPCSFSQSALPGRLVTSPVNGTVVRWRVVMWDAGSIRFRVLRPAVTGALFLHSGPAESAGDGFNTFVSALPISTGDRIGVQLLAPTSVFLGAVGPSAHPVPGAADDFWHSDTGGPPDGSTVPPSTSSHAVRAALQRRRRADQPVRALQGQPEQEQGDGDVRGHPPQSRGADHVRQGDQGHPRRGRDERCRLRPEHGADRDPGEGKEEEKAEPKRQGPGQATGHLHPHRRCPEHGVEEAEAEEAL